MVNVFSWGAGNRLRCDHFPGPLRRRRWALNFHSDTFSPVAPAGRWPAFYPFSWAGGWSFSSLLPPTQTFMTLALHERLIPSPTPKTLASSAAHWSHWGSLKPTGTWTPHSGNLMWLVWGVACASPEAPQLVLRCSPSWKVLTQTQFLNPGTSSTAAQLRSLVGGHAFIYGFWGFSSLISGWQVLLLLLLCQSCPGLRTVECLMQEERLGCHIACFSFQNASSMRTGALSGVFLEDSSAAGTVLGTEKALSKPPLHEWKNKHELHRCVSASKKDLYLVDPQSWEESHLMERTPRHTKEEQRLLPLPQLSPAFWWFLSHLSLAIALCVSLPPFHRLDNQGSQRLKICSRCQNS